MNLTKRQTATVLAALRHWQRADAKAIIPELDILTNCGEFEGLGTAEINALCEALNCDKPEGSALIEFAGRTLAILETTAEWSSDTPDAIADAAFAGNVAHCDAEGMFKAGPKP